MARKKRKKERTETTRERSPSGLGTQQESEKSREFASRRNAGPGEEWPAADARKGEDLGLRPERQFDSATPPEREPEQETFLGRLSRWLQGEPAPTYSPPRPQPQAYPKSAPAVTPEPVQREPEPPPPPPAPPERAATPGTKLPGPEQAGTVPPSKVDHVLAVLTLERVLPELDAARKQLEEMKISSGQKIQELEAECDQLRAEIEKGQGEESAAAAAKARRLQEELDEARKTSQARIQQLETERDQLRAEIEKARAAQPAPADDAASDRLLREELARKTAEERAQRLERERDQLRAEIEKGRGAGSSAAGASKGRLQKEIDEGRIQQLEAERDQSRSETESARSAQDELNQRIRELEAARTQTEQEREGAQTRIGQLESERAEMESKLAAKEKKLMDALAQIEEVHEQAQRLEEEMAALRNVEAERDELSTRLTATKQELLSASQQASRISELEAELTELKTHTATQTTGQTEALEGAAPVPAALGDLYQQTMSRLTVIQASAELLAMNSRLDASARDTAKDIRTESQLLSDIIKKFTLPPDTRKAE